MPSYLVTGAGRGLGLGFVTELLQNKDNVVVATARKTASSTGLQDLKAKVPKGSLFLVDLDVSNADSVNAAAEETSRLLPDGLDHLISNAGVAYNSMKSFEDIDLGEFTREIEFNVVGTVHVIRAFLPLVRKGQTKKFLFITSSLGSVTLGDKFPHLENTYSVGKASLNMLVRKWGSYLKNDGIIMGLIHPGWVGSTGLGSAITDYVKQNAPDLPNIPVPESVAGCLKILHGLTPEENGAFFNFDGSTFPF